MNIDWSESETGCLEGWKNPLHDIETRLKIADGAVSFRNDTIKNLRSRLKEVTTVWKKASEGMPEAGRMITKKWNNGAVWAGRYSGSVKESSFDYWCYLPEDK